MTKKTLLVLILFLSIVCTVRSQGISTLKDKVFLGGNFWLAFGNPTEILIAPRIGYKFTDQLSAGITSTYRYRKIDLGRTDVRLNDYGGGIFVRNYFNEFIFAQGEYEYLNYSTYSVNVNESVNYDRDFLNSLFLGGGISYPVSNGLIMSVILLYNINYDNNGPYDSPLIVRGGVSVGF